MARVIVVGAGIGGMNAALVGRWVNLAELAFEKYFLAQMKSGNTEPIHQKYVVKALGIDKLK